MKIASRIAICLVALLPTVAFAQLDPATPAARSVHVKVQVISEFFGSFTKEQDVALNQTATFNNLSEHHKGVVYDGPCAITPPKVGKAPQDVDDGVAVEITPFSSINGVVGAEHQIRAGKFLGYNTFDSGSCGKANFIRAARWDTGARVLYRSEEPQIIDTMVSDDAGGRHHLVVVLTISPVATTE